MKEMSTIKFPNQTEAYEIVDAAARLSVAEKSNIGHTHTTSEITDFAHEHDGRYYTKSEVDVHINNNSNPHNVTAEQIGAMEKVNPTGTGSFSLNRAADTTIGDYSFAEGTHTTATGIASHAEGANTTVSNDYSHAEGYGVVVEGAYAHGEGADTRAKGAFSHAQNHYAEANGAYSHAEGTHTIAQGNAQHVQGQWNIADSTSAHIVGNGTAEDARSNAYTLDWEGNAEFAGDIVADGCNSTESPISLRNVNTRTASLEIAIADINSGIKVYAQDDEPTTPKERDIWIDTDEASESITIDEALSETSINAVQNKIITTALNGKVDTPTLVVEEGAAPTITIADNTEYRLVDIDGLDMFGNTNKAHGFIYFASWFENGGLAVSGFTASSGDDLAQAGASEVWEFSCDNGYIVWKNWSA